MVKISKRAINIKKLIIILLSFSGFYLLLTVYSTHLEQSTAYPSFITTTNWKSYDDSKNNYIVKYPNEMYVDATFSDFEGSTILKFIHPRKKIITTNRTFLIHEDIIYEPVVKISVISTKLPLDDYIKFINANEIINGKQANFQKSTENEKTIYRLEILDDSQPEFYLSALFALKGKIFQVTFQTPELNSNLRNLYNLILSSISI